MQKKLEQFIKVLIGASFFLPLVVVPTSYIFPFIVPKILLFRSISLLMLGGFILLLASNWSEYKIRLNPINIIVALFFVSFSVSTFIGVDWYRSFWDNHERMLGLFTIFHFIVYYFVATSVVREWKDWQWLLRAFLFAGGIVMFIGFLQKFANPELLMNRGSGRVSATLGNPIYFSGYGLFLMFIGYLLAIKEYVVSRFSSFWFWFAAVGSFLGFLGIFMGGTRGALLGLLAGLGVLFVYYAINLKEHKKARKIITILIICGATLSGILFGFRNTDFVKNIPAVGRLVDISFSSGTANTRLMAWGIAVDAWQEKPVFGWGPNNYYYAFNKYYRAEFLEHGWGETWFDNAHSVIMNTLAVQGGLGFAIYFGIYVVAIAILWKKYRHGKIDVHILSVGAAFLIAHLASLVTVFENPTSYLYFFFFLAFINSQSTDYSLESKEKKSRQISTSLLIIVAFVIALLIYSTNINPARANKATFKAVKSVSLGSGDIVQMYEGANKIPSPHIDDIRNDFSRSLSNIILPMSESGKKDEAKQLLDLAREELKKNLELHPLDIRAHVQLAQLDSMGLELDGGVELLLEAESILEDALKLSPKRQQVQYMLSVFKLRLGKTQEAVDLIQDSIDNDPYIAEGWLRLVNIYASAGMSDEVARIIEQAQVYNVVLTAEERKQIENLLSANNK